VSKLVVGNTSKNISGVAFFILFAGEFISNLGDSPLTRFEFPKKNPAQQIVTKTWIKSW
jgi:hypothetical protein